MPRGEKELAEQIIPKLREVEVEVGRGKTVLEAVKKIGVTEQPTTDGRRSLVVCGSTERTPGMSCAWAALEHAATAAVCSMGERLRGKLQREAPARVANAGSVRHAARRQGADRAVAAALQDRPAAQCPWVSPPGPRGDAAVCGCYGCASSTAHGWSVGGQKPTLETGVIHGGRSIFTTSGGRT
jgi:hypothetical protein